MIKWPPQKPGSLATWSCKICGAIVGLKFGDDGNRPTDWSDEHADWHRELDKKLADARGA